MENHIKYSKGVCWISDCRIPFVDTEDIDFTSTQSGKVYGRNSLNESITKRNTTHYTTQGRFTPNLLVCDDMLNDGSISKTGDINPYLSKDDGIWGIMKGKTHINSFKGDKGTNSRYYDLDKWFDKIIDEIQ